MLKQRRSESVGSPSSAPQDVRRALLIVRARRREEKISVEAESSIGLDPKYVPFEQEDLKELEDEFEEQSDFRRRSYSNDVVILRKTSRPMTVEVLGALKMDDNPYTQYLKAITCYDLAPTTGQVIMLDVQLSIQRGFAALLQESERVGVVYDTITHSYLSLITQTDFLTMIYHARRTNDMGMHKRPILWWVNTVAEAKKNADISYIQDADLYLHLFKANDSALDGVRALCMNKIQRAPIFDDNGSVLYFLGLKRVLYMLQKQIRGSTIPPWMLHSVQSARIGTWHNVRSVSPDALIVEAVELMLNHSLSTLPVIRDGKLLNVLTKSDIVFYALYNLIADELVLDNELNDLMNSSLISCHHLDMFDKTVAEALAMRSANPFQTHGGSTAFCNASDTVVSVIDKLVASQCRCVYVLNEKGSAEAAVSISDLMKYLVIENHPIRQPQRSPMVPAKNATSRLAKTSNGINLSTDPQQQQHLQHQLQQLHSEQQQQQQQQQLRAKSPNHLTSSPGLISGFMNRSRSPSPNPTSKSRNKSPRPKSPKNGRKTETLENSPADVQKPGLRNNYLYNRLNGVSVP